MKAVLIIFAVGVALCAILAIGITLGGYKCPDDEDDAENNVQ